MFSLLGSLCYSVIATGVVLGGKTTVHSCIFVFVRETLHRRVYAHEHMVLSKGVIERCYLSFCSVLLHLRTILIIWEL